MARGTRGKGEGAVYKRASDGMWCTSVELPRGIDGKRRRKVICRKTKPAVMDEMRKIQSDLAVHGDLETNSITLNQWATYWMDKIAPKKIKPRTLAGYRTVVNGYIIPLLGKKTLGKITARDVRALHDLVETTPKDPALRDGRPLPEDTVMLSSTYALLTHNALSVMLDAAIADGKLKANPCEVVTRPAKRKAEQAALTLEQAIQLMSHLPSRKDTALWATYLLTGARRGEIIGLERDRVTNVLDLSWQMQRITDITKAPGDFEYRQVKGTLYLTRPKSKSGWRVIPLVPPLSEILDLHLQDAPADGLIFLEDGRPWDPDRVTKAWKKLMVDAGLPEDVVLHGARHTTVDLLYGAGVPEDIIQAIVGHSSRQTTRAYRTRTDSARLSQGMESLSALFRPQIEP